MIAGLLAASDAHATAPAFPGVNTTTVQSPDTELPIPDSSSLVSELTVDVPGALVDVDVTVDISHPSSGQLDLYLVSPAGTTITLSTVTGGAKADLFAPATFDDQAPGTPSAACIRNITTTSGVAVGTVQPEGAMAAVVGEPAAGPWALVVVDHTGGSTGTLHGWSLTLSTLSSLPPTDPPVVLDGAGAAIPDNDLAGAMSTVQATGLGRRLLDVDVTVSITHPRASDLDLYLTGPSGTRIDLVTRFGGGNANLYQGTTFDDSAPSPISDTPLPPSGTAFGAVVPEGALGAFVGDDPNGTWTLTVVDHTAGTTGTLDSWSLRLTTVSSCGDGVVEAGEACDDGNSTDGDGCDHDCSVSACGNGIVGGDEQCDDGNTVDGDGCSSTCKLEETVCDDCRDDDRNGLVDAADPACGGAALALGKASASAKTGTLAVRGTVALGDGAGGPVEVVLADGNGTVFCTALGQAVAKGRKLVASGAVGAGSLTATFRGGAVALKGRGLDLAALDDPNVTIGLAVGAQRFRGSAVFRTRGGKRVHP